MATAVRWFESSEAEISLACQVGDWLWSRTRLPDSLCLIFDDIAEKIIGGEALVSPGGRCDPISSDLLTAFPALRRLDVAASFPKDSSALTTNFFSRLAQEMENRFADPADRGLVGTPAVLALDMVSLAASCWLAARLRVPVTELTRLLSGKDAIQSQEKHGAVQGLLSSAKWYDPCVGGGVFPLAVVSLLSRLGVRPSDDMLPNITGSDISLLGVAAAKVRMALAISHLTGRSYLGLRTRLDHMFVVRNSLESNSEQQLADLGGSVGTLGRADIVVGNPPYVRADRMSKRDKALLRQLYPSVAGGTVDLYSYFIAHGIISLNEGGVLCYVSPASFQKSKYGASTRRYLAEHGALQVLFDFDELPVFENVSLHASVYAIAKNARQEEVLAFAFGQLPPDTPLVYGLERAVTLPPANASPRGWQVNTSDVQEVLASLSRNSVSLLTYAGKILSGIKTGHKEAYYLSRSKAEILADAPEVRPFIKPLLRPVSIRAWQPRWDGTHLIFVQKGEKLPPDSPLLTHLRQYESGLRNRSDVKGHPTWYGLRECKYHTLFARPKIIFPDIASQCRFAMDEQGFFIPDGAFMIPTHDYFLLGLLNSCVARFYFRARCNSIGNPLRGGRLRFKKTYVAEFPVPSKGSFDAILGSRIAELARALSDGIAPTDAAEELDLLVLQVYSIPRERWHLFLGSPEE